MLPIYKVQNRKNANQKGNFKKFRESETEIGSAMDKLKKY